MRPKDPPRWLSPNGHAPDDLAEVLRAGKQRLPDDERMAALTQRLEATVGEPLTPDPQGGGGGAAQGGAGGAAQGGAGGAAQGGAMGMAKLATGIVMGALAVGGVGYLLSPEPAAPPPATPAMAASAESAPAVGAGESLAPAAVGLPPQDEPPGEELHAQVPPAQHTPKQKERASKPNPSASDSNPPPAGSTNAAVDSGDVDAELRLLREAQDALRSNPARSLALTEEYRRRYPRSMLGQECSIIAIEALVLLGRREEARARAAAFLRNNPKSAHRARLEVLVGALGTPEQKSAHDPDAG